VCGHAGAGSDVIPSAAADPPQLACFLIVQSPAKQAHSPLHRYNHRSRSRKNARARERIALIHILLVQGLQRVIAGSQRGEGAMIGGTDGRARASRVGAMTLLLLLLAGAHPAAAQRRGGGFGGFFRPPSSFAPTAIRPPAAAPAPFAPTAFRPAPTGKAAP